MSRPVAILLSGDTIFAVPSTPSVLSSIMNDMDPMSSQVRPRILYHGSRAPNVLRELHTSDWEQVENGKKDKWLFASPRKDHALIFATLWDAQSAFLSRLEGGDSDTEVLFRNDTREEMRARSWPTRFVYSFGADGFEPNQDSALEWISNKPLPVKGSQVGVTGYQGIKPALKLGVQIMNLKKGCPRSFLNFKSPDFLFPGGISRATLAEVLKRPDSPLTWENLATGLGPDKDLLAAVQRSLRP